MPPSTSDSPFWSELFRIASSEHPEIINLTPTDPDKKRKIAPTIVRNIQVDIQWSSRNGVTCSLLSRKPECLKPYLVDREAFEREVGIPTEWSEGSSKHLGVPVKPAPPAIQKSWSMTRQAEEAVKLYGEMKRFILSRTYTATE